MPLNTTWKLYELQLIVYCYRTIPAWHRRSRWKDYFAWKRQR